MQELRTVLFIKCFMTDGSNLQCYFFLVEYFLEFNDEH